MKHILIAILLLLPTVAGAGQGMFPLPMYYQNGGGSTCSTQSIDASFSTVQKSTADIYANTIYGQSWTPTATSEIYSITVGVYYATGQSTTDIYIRVGDQADLSSTYDVEEHVSLDGYTLPSDVEIVFTTKPSMTSGVTKYFMVWSSGATPANAFKLYRTNYDGYAGGTEYSSTTGLANVATVAEDLSFAVKKCDN